MDFDLSYAAELVPTIVMGSVVTLQAAAWGCLGAVIVGLLLALGRRSRRGVRTFCIAIVELVRLSPFLAQLYFFYYALPVYGIVLPAMVVGVVVLSFHFGSFLSEVFGAGIDAVPNGQIEAARALGLSRWKTTRLIVLPQMMRLIAAPTANYFISLFKTTPYLATIGVPEMLGVALDSATSTFRYVEPLTVVGLLFLIYCGALGLLGRTVEKRMGSFSSSRPRWPARIQGKGAIDPDRRRPV